VILSAVRLPTGKFLGALKGFTAPSFGSMVVKEAVARAGLAPDVVDEVIMGNVVSAASGRPPRARPPSAPASRPRSRALTINKVVLGPEGRDAGRAGDRHGDSEVVVAGGMESMSNCPYLFPRCGRECASATGRRSTP